MGSGNDAAPPLAATGITIRNGRIWQGPQPKSWTGTLRLNIATEVPAGIPVRVNAKRWLPTATGPLTPAVPAAPHPGARFATGPPWPIASTRQAVTPRDDTGWGGMPVDVTVRRTQGTRPSSL